jgi:hypothetical protein
MRQQMKRGRKRLIIPAHNPRRSIILQRIDRDFRHLSRLINPDDIKKTPSLAMSLSIEIGLGNARNDTCDTDTFINILLPNGLGKRVHEGLARGIRGRPWNGLETSRRAHVQDSA